MWGFTFEANVKRLNRMNVLGLLEAGAALTWRLCLARISTV